MRCSQVPVRSFFERYHQIEGRLMLKEIGGSGSESLQICLDRTLLYVKDRSGNGPSCPSQLDFSLQLPTTFEYRGVTYVSGSERFDL